MDTNVIEEEVSHEPVKKEMQDLLESEVDNNSESRVYSDFAGTSCEQDDRGSRVITREELALLLNDKMKKSGSNDVTSDEITATTSSVNEIEEAGDKITGNHLILVTENGDRIFLIQNSNGADSEDVSQENQAQEVVNCIGEDGSQQHIHQEQSQQQELQHNEQIDISSPSFRSQQEIDEEEESIQTQMQHKLRQKMLLMQLDKLRAKHKERMLNQTQQPSFNNDEQSNDGLIFLDDTGLKVGYNSIPDNQSSNALDCTDSWKSLSLMKNQKISKWLVPLLRNLDKAHSFVQNRGRKIEQWSKFFPSASHNFESRCSDLRQDLLRLELNIERFQNIFSKQLDTTEMKLKSFIADFHLESFAQEMDDEEDENKEIRGHCSTVSASSSFHDSHSSNTNHRPTRSSLKGSKISSSTDLAISSKDHLLSSSRKDNFTDFEEEQVIEDCRDMEPVPEIRDVNSDSPIPVDEITGDVNIISEDEDESRFNVKRAPTSRMLASSTPQSTVTVELTKVSQSVKSSNSNNSPKKTVITSNSSQLHTRHSSRLTIKRPGQSTDLGPLVKLRTPQSRKRGL